MTAGQKFAEACKAHTAAYAEAEKRLIADEEKGYATYRSAGARADEAYDKAKAAYAKALAALADPTHTIV